MLVGEEWQTGKVNLTFTAEEDIRRSRSCQLLRFIPINRGKKMEKYVHKLTDEALKEYPIRDFLAGWFFRVDEVSQGFHRVEGIDYWGRKISRMGVDPEQLLSNCKNDIEEMQLG